VAYNIAVFLHDYIPCSSAGARPVNYDWRVAVAVAVAVAGPGVASPSSRLRPIVATERCRWATDRARPYAVILSQLAWSRQFYAHALVFADCIWLLQLNTRRRGPSSGPLTVFRVRSINR